MTAIDRDAVLALLDRVIANCNSADVSLARVLRLQVERLPHIQIDERGLAITGGVAQ